MFVKHSQELPRRREYIGRLEQSLDLLKDVPESQLYQDYTYFLALLYEVDGQYDKATTMLLERIQSLGSRDTCFVYLCGKILLKQFKNNEEKLKVLKEKVEEMLSQCAKPDPSWNLPRLRQHALYQAQLMQVLAQTYIVRKESPEKIRTLLYDQYLLAPRQPISLNLLAEYCYGQGEYTRDMNLFQDLQHRLPKSEEFSIWLARLYARNNKMEKVHFYIYRALLQNGGLSPQDLEQYIELRPLMQLPEVLKIWQKKDE
jgi:tetratricopeptide (TPR) repeat protein